MTAIKEKSTNQLNKQLNTWCPVTFTLAKIGGRWKPMIIYNLLHGPRRYSELKRAIPNITEKMLIQTLKELEVDLLLKRNVKATVPPHVEYSLTQVGLELGPVLDKMVEWAMKNGG